MNFIRGSGGNRFFNPNEQFCDSAGLTYAGGTLDFYASGTSTRLNTYSDSALSIANTNPVVLDSAGRAGERDEHGKSRLEAAQQ